MLAFTLRYYYVPTVQGLPKINKGTRRSLSACRQALLAGHSRTLHSVRENPMCQPRQGYYLPVSLTPRAKSQSSSSESVSRRFPPP
jgi:hypothetical protein